MKGYAPACRDEAFTEASEQFAQTEEWLAGEAVGLQHAELEEQLEVRGRELVRRQFQWHLDLLAACEGRRDDVAGEDGVVRARAERGRSRPLVTKFGQVSVSRIASPRSRPRGSMEAAGAAITRPTGVTIGKRQAEELARPAPPMWRRFTRSGRPGSRRRNGR